MYVLHPNKYIIVLAAGMQETGEAVGRQYFSGALPGTCTRKTIFSLRHDNFEPHAFAISPRFFHDEPGDRQDLPAQEHSEARVLPESLLKDPFLLFIVNADPVIFVYDCDISHSILKGGEGDVPHPLAVAEGVVDQVLEDLPEERIGIDFKAVERKGEGDLPPAGRRDRRSSATKVTFCHCGARTPISS